MKQQSVCVCVCVCVGNTSLDSPCLLHGFVSAVRGSRRFAGLFVFPFVITSVTSQLRSSHVLIICRSQDKRIIQFPATFLRTNSTSAKTAILVNVVVHTLIAHRCIVIRTCSEQISSLLRTSVNNNDICEAMTVNSLVGVSVILSKQHSWLPPLVLF